jgi:DNA-binding GntR family transcriptional regulator
LTEQDLDALERLLTDGEHAHAVEDVDASLQFGDAFHATLYRRCGMPRLIALIENLISAAGLYVAVTGGAGSMRPEIVAAHRAIFDACKARVGGTPRRRNAVLIRRARPMPRSSADTGGHRTCGARCWAAADR